MKSDYENLAGSPAMINQASFLSELGKYIRFLKNCGTASGCWYNGMTKYMNGSNWTNFDVDTVRNRAILVDGTMVWTGLWDTSCMANPIGGAVAGSPFNGKICGEYWIDINGTGTPNVVGRDVFGFYITENGAFPMGYMDSRICDPSSSGSNNYGCANKVLSENAVNY